MKVRFFVTGMGRSGTVWLARLLNCDRNVTVKHEATANWDAGRYGKCYQGILDVDTWLDTRVAWMENHWEAGSFWPRITPSTRKWHSIFWKI